MSNTISNRNTSCRAPRRKPSKELKEASKKVGTIYLATDPDREGEAIAWHLATQIQQEGVPFKRVVFHEITEEAVKEAFKTPSFR